MSAGSGSGSGSRSGSAPAKDLLSRLLAGGEGGRRLYQQLKANRYSAASLLALVQRLSAGVPASRLSLLAVEAAHTAMQSLFHQKQKLTCKPLALHQLYAALISNAFASQRHYEICVRMCLELISQLSAVSSSSPSSSSFPFPLSLQQSSLYVRVYLIQSGSLLALKSSEHFNLAYTILSNQCSQATERLHRLDIAQGQKAYENMFRTCFKGYTTALSAANDVSDRAILQWKVLLMRLLLFSQESLQQRFLRTLDQALKTSSLDHQHQLLLSVEKSFSSAAKLWQMRSSAYDLDADLLRLHVQVRLLRSLFKLAPKALDRLIQERLAVAQEHVAQIKCSSSFKDTLVRVLNWCISVQRCSLVVSAGFDLTDGDRSSFKSLQQCSIELLDSIQNAAADTASFLHSICPPELETVKKTFLVLNGQCSACDNMHRCLSALTGADTELALVFSAAFQVGAVLLQSPSDDDVEEEEADGQWKRQSLSIDCTVRAIKTSFHIDRLDLLHRCIELSSLSRTIRSHQLDALWKSFAATVFNCGILLFNRLRDDVERDDSSHLRIASQLFGRATLLYDRLQNQALVEAHTIKSISLQVQCLCRLHKQTEALDLLVDQVFQRLSSNSNPDLNDLIRLFVSTKLSLNVSTTLSSFVSARHQRDVDLLSQKRLLQCELAVFSEIASTDSVHHHHQALLQELLALPDERLSRLERASALLSSARLHRLSSGQQEEEEDTVAIERIRTVLLLLTPDPMEEGSSASSLKLQAQARLWLGVFLHSTDAQLAVDELQRSLRCSFDAVALPWNDNEDVVELLQLILEQGSAALQSSPPSDSGSSGSDVDWLRCLHLLSELLESVGHRLMHCRALYVLLQLLLPSQDSDLNSTLLISSLDAVAQLSLSLAPNDDDDALVASLFALLDRFTSRLARSAKVDVVEVARVHLSAYTNTAAAAAAFTSASARAEHLLALSSSSFRALQLQQALKHSSQALQLVYQGPGRDVARSIASGRLLVRALLGAGLAAEASGEHFRALYFFSRALTVSDEVPAPSLALEAIGAQTRVHLRRGDAQAASDSVALLRQRHHHHHHHRRPEIALLEGDICRLQGRLQDAAHFYQDAVDATTYQKPPTQAWDEQAVLLCRCRRRLSVMQEKLGALQKASKLIEALLSDEPLLERAGPLQRAHCLLTHALSLLARSRKKVEDVWLCDINSVRAFSTRTLVGRARVSLRSCIAIAHSCGAPVLLRRAFTALADLHGRCEVDLTAMSINHSIGITARNELLFNANSRLPSEEHVQADELDAIFSSLSINDNARSMSSSLEFDADLDAEIDKFRADIAKIPPSWAVVTLTLSGASLLASRIQAGHNPVVLSVPLNDEQLDSVLPEFEAIIADSKNSTATDSQKEVDARQWWKRRRELDRRIGSVLESMENDWLSAFKGLLLPSCSDCPRLQACLRRLHEEHPLLHDVDEEVLELILASSEELSNTQLLSALRFLLGPTTKESTTATVARTIRSCAGDFRRQRNENRGHVILILGRELQHLPWESLPCCRSMSISRMPSLPFLMARLDADSHVHNVDVRSSFFVLNPSRDLADTQQRLQHQFVSREGWTGFVGEAPSKSEWAAALRHYDLFVYCGHSAGEQFCSSHELKRQQVRSTALLMGCSSALLRGYGDYEPSGVSLAYMLSGAPAVMGNLWDVTDADIDRFSEALLSTWLDPAQEKREGVGSREHDLVSAIPLSRNACKLRFLVGASPICYGVPVRATLPNTTAEQRLQSTRRS